VPHNLQNFNLEFQPGNPGRKLSYYETNGMLSQPYYKQACCEKAVKKSWVLLIARELACNLNVPVQTKNTQDSWLIHSLEF
jgi:hypothetical protein